LTRLTRILVLAAIAAALFAVGCGDDDDDETSPTTTTTEAGATGTTGAVAESKEQWITTADEVCATADDELTSALQQTGLSENSSAAEQESAIAGTVLPIQRSVLETLRSLGPPEGEEENVNELLNALESGLDEIEADPASALEDGDANPLAEAEALAEAYGLQECGN
jgi:hypothetical protein